MSKNNSLILAALQIEPAPNPTDTFLQIKESLNQIQSQNETPDCVVLPEYAFGTFRKWAATKQESDQFTKRIHDSICHLAQEYKIPIVAGTIPYQTEKHKWRNRSYLFSSNGEILGSYDKQHPFRAEKRLGLEAGIQTSTFKIRNFRVAILICSDLWFHDLVSQIASEVDFLAVPAMTTVLDSEQIHYGQWTWQSLIAVRAKEYTIPIVSADQASREYAPGVFTCGGSCIADPSYRFRNTEGPSSQALKIAPSNSIAVVVSRISLESIHEYKAYRQDVGLRE
ncbi:MAG: carbon-nitrogen hydrolase family protein [Candidatus Hermodarchaeota archaeon]